MKSKAAIMTSIEGASAWLAKIRDAAANGGAAAYETKCGAQKMKTWRRRL